MSKNDDLPEWLPDMPRDPKAVEGTTTMRDGELEARFDWKRTRHASPHATWPPTGKRAAWSGMALCYVQRVRGRWQYVAEWVVHDELATAMQVGPRCELI